jgi:hypothetical protein
MLSGIETDERMPCARALVAEVRPAGVGGQVGPVDDRAGLEGVQAGAGAGAVLDLVDLFGPGTRPIQVVTRCHSRTEDVTVLTDDARNADGTPSMPLAGRPIVSTGAGPTGHLVGPLSLLVGEGNHRTGKPVMSTGLPPPLWLVGGRVRCGTEGE